MIRGTGEADTGGTALGRIDVVQGTVLESDRAACPKGLEPRPIAELVQVASKYESKIYLETDTKRVNAKSIMGMMSLNLANGDLLTVTTEGKDEEGAMDEILSALKDKLNLMD